jgi:hypothetical protein
MHDSAVTQLRPRAPSAYSDTAALNDIHALLTTTVPGDGELADIAQIVERTGRPLVAVLEISTTETALGWPVACAQSGDTSVFIRQAPGGAGLLVEACTRTAAEHDALTVILDGLVVHPARPGRGDAA